MDTFELEQKLQHLVLQFEYDNKVNVSSVESYYGDIIDFDNNEAEGHKFLVNIEN